MQNKDKECQRLKRRLGQGKGTTRSLNGGVGFFLKDGLLMATRGHTPDRRDNARALVPEALRGHLISTYHRSPMLCHPGITITIQTIANTYYWAGMAEDIKRAISGCLGCKRTKTPELFKKTEDFGMVPENPLSVISLDLYGPMPPDSSGNVYVLVIVDNLTRWSSLVPLGGRSQGHVGAREVASAVLREWIANYGTPDIIISDKGAQFESLIWTELARSIGFTSKRAPADAHWGVARPERFNAYMKARVKMWKATHRGNWSELLPFINMANRFLVIPRLNRSPFELLFGFKPRMPFATITPARMIPESAVEKSVVKMHAQTKKSRNSCVPWTEH